MSITKRKSFNADCKDGYTQIANLILEALPMARINGTQMSICLFLLRRTYGWQTDHDAISLREFAAACGGSSIPYISRQVNDLLRKRIIRRLVFEPGRTPVYEFVTNVEEWEGNSIDLALLAGNEAGEVYQLSKERFRRGRSMGVEALYNCGGGYPEGLSEPASLVLYQQAREGLSFPATVNEHPPPARGGIESGLKKEIKKANKKTHFYRENEWPFRLAQLLLIKIKETLPGFKTPDLQS
ncbi:MAG: replication protein, partial [Clostridiaceae bacterium]|nr:replication protein [Clostridiaceae bacterium]